MRADHRRCRMATPAALLLMAGALAPAGAQDAATLAAQGNGKGAAPCQTCHAPDGSGQAAGGFPRLAGLDAAYLRAQLDAFAAGTRENAVMQPQAAALTEAERQALASYFSKLPAVATPDATGTAPLPDADLGRVLATRGRWSRQLPACEQCHGPGGVGVGANFPPLAGQSAHYLASQLKAFRSGSRHNDPLGLMQKISRSLSDRDIDAVAHWFAAQPFPPKAHAAARVVSATAPAAGSGAAPPVGPAPHTQAAAKAKSASAAFEPPPESAIPQGPFGDMVRLGYTIFVDTDIAAKAYVGNGLRCSNCHLDAGRLANAAPLWGAYVVYPAYRAKNGHVNTLGERLQGCFKYSMNGKAPPLDSKEMVALETYAFWMAKGAPTGEKLPGAGFPKKGFKPPQPPDYARGERVFERYCALCHGADGQGRAVAGRYVFPPLWGPDSFNWGAGMGQLDNAAAFIEANMPLSQGGTLSAQDAWDVAMYMDAHERPQDPRYTGDLAATRRAYHDTPMSLYGTTVNGHLLGSAPARRN